MANAPTLQEIFKDLAIKFCLMVGWAFIGGLIVHHMPPGEIVTDVIRFMSFCVLVGLIAMFIFSILRIFLRGFKNLWP